MTVHVRDLNIDNLLAVCRELPQDEQDVWATVSGRVFDPVDATLWLMRAPGLHYIIHNGDQPLAGAGFLQQRPGVYRTWMIAAPIAWEPYGREVTRVVRDAIQEIIAQGVAHRVETITLADRKRAQDWYPKIGLQFETTHRKYGSNGEDAVVYVALRDSETQ